MNRNRLVALCLLSSVMIMASCGGGGDSGTSATTAAAAAAAATASSNSLCNAIRPFYWEIGDRTGVLASGSVGTGFTADTTVNIASASKWLFAAYVIEKYGDVAANVPYLNFTSGYSNFDNSLCLPSQTVAQCNNGAINVAEASAVPPIFHYQGGHMQQFAATDSVLSGLHIGTLAAEINSRIGNDVGLAYVEPQPPGGVQTTAREYAVFLRKLLVGASPSLRLGGLLGTHAVCTQPSATCNASIETAAKLPDNFHYSLGHWIEDDPAATPSSNFAYSSAGAFGFYPWVDAGRTLYGIVSRQDPSVVGETEGTGEGYSSIRCGRLIRLAWKTGVAQQ